MKLENNYSNWKHLGDEELNDLINHIRDRNTEEKIIDRYNSLMNKQNNTMGINFWVSASHEPKKNNRFTVEFPEFYNIPPSSIKKINKPKLTKDGWYNIEIVFDDLISVCTSKQIFDIANKSLNKDILFDFNIFSIDPTGVKIEKWVISVKEIISIDFGNLDISDDGIQQIVMIVKPSDCKLIY